MTWHKQEDIWHAKSAVMHARGKANRREAWQPCQHDANQVQIGVQTERNSMLIQLT